ncbi:hypothetical protein Hanom_Chr03g00245441 [Helianthus anomalus]
MHVYIQYNLFLTYSIPFPARAYPIFYTNPYTHRHRYVPSALAYGLLHIYLSYLM